MSAVEFNFDGIVGPTHNYGGLSYGNEASVRSTRAASNPRDAALQGLAKMKLLHDLGVPQAVLPPHDRPAVEILRRVGFSGSDADVLAKAAKQAPDLVVASASASPMWTANAATVSPSADTIDGRVHFTPANLINKFHRSFESDTTARLLRRVFATEEHFAHHQALPGNERFGDEGAANHTRLCAAYGDRGVELFVYGRSGSGPDADTPRRYPARQTREACAAIVRLHGLSDTGATLIRQNPAAIDAGVFHNDVIAVGNRNVLLYHERAFHQPAATLAAIRSAFGPGPLHLLEVPARRVSLALAVQSYLFNSQLVSLAEGEMLLLLPAECEEIGTVFDYVSELREGDNPVSALRFVDLRQSMRNGGGPACLRLRVVLTESERSAMHQGIVFTDDLFTTLTGWVRKHYRDYLTAEDLADPALLRESRFALDELTRILGLDSVYCFQADL